MESPTIDQSHWSVNGKPAAIQRLTDAAWDELAAEAIAIADLAMLERVMEHGLPDESAIAGLGGVVTMTDQFGIAVYQLCEADQALICAMEWLMKRGLADLITSEDGDESIYIAPTDNPNEGRA